MTTSATEMMGFSAGSTAHLHHAQETGVTPSPHKPRAPESMAAPIQYLTCKADAVKRLLLEMVSLSQSLTLTCAGLCPSQVPPFHREGSRPPRAAQGCWDAGCELMTM